MGLRDRRRGSQNVAARVEPSGRAAMPQDQRMNSRNQSDNLSGCLSEVIGGRVVHSLPQFGWHQVVLDNGGIMSAEPTGHADKWGSQSVNVYQPGTQVLCAINRQKNRCIVIAQIPDVVGDRNDQYVMASSLGAKTNLEKDPAAQVFLDSIKENDDTSSYEINAKGDQITGDWGCQTNTGIVVTVDSWGINLATDDVTGLSMDLLTQSFDLSGRNGTIETDLFRLASRQDAYSSQFSMGCFWVEDAYDTEKERKVDSDISESKYKYQSHNLVRSYNIIVGGGFVSGAKSKYYFPDWVYQSNVSPRGYQDDDGRNSISVAATYSLFDRSLLTGREIATMATELLAISTLMPGYKPSASEQQAHDQIVKRINKFQTGDSNNFSAMPLFPGSAPLGVIERMRDAYSHMKEHNKLSDGDLQPPDYLFTDRYEVGLLYNPSNDAFKADEAHKAVIENESIIASGTILNQQLAFDRAKLTQENKRLQRMDLRSIIQVDEANGDITIVNEHGAGIRISGNSVFIEGGNIRVVSQKDVRIFARDVSLSSNRNITFSSNKHIRIYSAFNTAITSGSGGSGGVLIESRGQNQLVTLPDDPDKAVYAGITIKSTVGPITALGGDVLLRAGDYLSGVPGRLLMTSGGGDVIIASRSRVVLHSALERLDTFGLLYTKPTSSHMYSAEQVNFKGTLSAGQIWSQGSVVARSDVQAVTGRVADAYGNLVGKVLLPALLLSSLQTLEKARGNSLQSWSQTVDQIADEVQGNGRILNRVISKEISSGYTKPEKVKTHYGPGKLSDTIPHLYRDALSIPTQPFSVNMVEYKPGTGKATKTYAYPGRPNEKIACMVQSPLVVKIASADEWSDNFQKREEQTFEQVFGTVQDLPSAEEE